MKLLQHYLIQLGYDLGKWGADGEFGDSTELAVMAFQGDHKLGMDGQYGPKSHAAMLEALEADEPEAEHRYVAIEGGNCYVRTAPNTDCKILGVAHRGDVLPYGGEKADNGWLLVAYKNENAWVSGKYGKLK